MGLLFARAGEGTFKAPPGACVISDNRFAVAVLKSNIVIEDFTSEAVAHENRSFLRSPSGLVIRLGLRNGRGS